VAYISLFIGNVCVKRKRREEEGGGKYPAAARCYGMKRARISLRLLLKLMLS